MVSPGYNIWTRLDISTGASDSSIVVCEEVHIKMGGRNSSFARSVIARIGPPLHRRTKRSCLWFRYCLDSPIVFEVRGLS